MVPGELPHVERECDYNLGDVVLGMPEIKEECEGARLEHQLPVIVTHGLCHLLGYKHNTLPQRQLVTGTSVTHNVLHMRLSLSLSLSPTLHQMYRREAAVLTAYNNAFGTRLHPLTTAHQQ